MAQDSCFGTEIGQNNRSDIAISNTIIYFRSSEDGIEKEKIQ